MSASTTTGSRTTKSENRGRRLGHRARGRPAKVRADKPATATDLASTEKQTTDGLSKLLAVNSDMNTNTNASAADTSATAATASDTTPNDVDQDQDTTEAVCWICAEPVKYYSLSACNHRTCHVCALRLRALYKKLECTFCKDPQSTVIFTTSPDADFSSYTPDLIPYKDPKLDIFFETEDMMEETLILLRFNCPDPECDYTATGWGDLKLHTRALHVKLLCDLCIRFKKVFAHEHALYPPNVLPLHLPSTPHRTGKQPFREPIEVHPLCAFCRECFFSDDELFVHMRERHEECFICKRNEIRDQYFQNYESLELHFSQAHFACTNSVCQAQKFVVFDSELDLKAHQVEVHGADMNSRDRKDARRVQAEFEFGDASGSGRRGRRDRGDREREREPPPHVVQLQNRVGGRRREAFGGHLTTTTDGAQVMPPAVASGHASPIRDDVDPLVTERHAAFIARLQNIAPNPTNATAAVKAAMRGYRANESSARDLISTVWNVLDNNLDDTASIINGVVDLLDEEEKKRDLLAAWNGFKTEQRQQFPDLVPTAVGSGYAGIASGRVLNAKHATATRSSQQSSRQLWDRVAQAASSSSSRTVPGAFLVPSSTTHVDRFPPLSGPSTPAFRQPQRQTPWTASSVGGGSGGGSGGSGSGSLGTAVVAAGGSTVSITTNAGIASTTSPAGHASSRKKGKGGPRAGAGTAAGAKAVRPLQSLSAVAFPELPRAKPNIGGNASLRHIFGDAMGPATSVWKANESGSGNGQEASGGGSSEVVRETQGLAVQEQPETTGGKGRKGKGKQKQTLFTLGSFPA